VGQWNRQEVTCRDGTIRRVINGLEVSGATGVSIDRGPIGWQSGGAPIRFRNVELRTLD
jgi:hypothetical protein